MAGVAGRSGRKPTREKHARPVAAAEKKIADRLPELVDNLLHLAAGGYERVEEKWETREVRRLEEGPDGEPIPVVTTELVLAERKVSIADKDRAANQYLVDRILGKPTQQSEVSGPDGGPIPVQGVPPDLSQLSEAELATLASILGRAAADAGGDPGGAGAAGDA